jgi:8-oxo-dGTP diphosphatase
MTHHCPGVSVAVFKDDCVLLVKRGRAPYLDYWSLPGGTRQQNESMEEAACRELAEETGLTCNKLTFIMEFEPGIQAAETDASQHYCLSVFSCLDFSGTTIAGDDAIDAVWCKVSQLNRYQLTPGLAEIIDQLRQSRV